VLLGAVHRCHRRGRWLFVCCHLWSICIQWFKFAFGHGMWGFQLVFLVCWGHTPILVGVLGFHFGLRLVRGLYRPTLCGMRRCNGFLWGSGLVCVGLWVCWYWDWCIFGSGLRGFCHGGGEMWSRVLRECSFSKCVCSMLIIWGGRVAISSVVESRMASSLDWSLALGCF
jgi:hypothetical protein